MAAITWRNINAPDLSGASRMLDSAGDRLNSALRGAERIVTDQHNQNAQAFENERDRNTQNMLDTLTRYGESANLEKDILTGSIQQQVAGYGKAVDRAAIRQAGDARLKLLRSNEQAEVTQEQNEEKHKDVLTTNAQTRAIREENQEFANYTRGRTVTKNNRIDQGNSDVTAMINRITSARGTAVDTANAIYQDYGVPVVDGQPVLTGLTSAQRNAMYDQLREAGVGDDFSTRGRKALGEIFRKNNLTQAEQAQLTSDFDAGVARTTELSPRLQTLKNNELTLLDQHYDQAVKRNPFVATSSDPYADANATAEDFLANDPDLDNFRWFGGERGTRENLIKKLNAVYRDGVSIPSRDPETGDYKELNVKVPPSIVKLALTTKGDNSTAGSLEGVIRDYLTAGTPEQQEDLLRQIQEAESLNSDYSTQKRAIENRYENRGGNQYSATQNLMETLRRTR